MEGEALNLELEGRGRSASEAIAYAGNFLERRMAAVDREAFALLRTPEGLSPEKAMQLWHRKAAIHELVTDLNAAMQVGERASGRLAATRQAPPVRAPLP